MASMLHSESRRLYSWWWDSHISPKNSKWLQENLTDMDAKVKAMIKLIEEDADSFARRAEMYYEKRPELMKLVEEFYRAFRALAERYNHATGELRHAQQTMAKAFPNQVPFVLAKDPPSGCSAHGTEPHTPEIPHPIRALLDPNDLHKDVIGLSMSDLHAVKKNESFTGESDYGIGKKGSKQLHEVFGAKLDEGKVSKGQSYDVEESLHSNNMQLSNENQNLKAKVLSESERAVKAEREVQNLKKALADVHAEKESVLLQHQQNLRKLSYVEGELNCALKDSRRLNEQASKAETEVHTLKEALVMLQAEKDAGFTKQKEYLEMITNLEGMVAQTFDEAKGIDKRAVEAESEAEYLRNKLSRLDSEKEEDFRQYKQCRNKISNLENKVSAAEENARLFRDQAARAEIEVEKLKRALSELNEEKEALGLLYEHCLEKISKLEFDLSSAQEDVKRLNIEILMGTTKLKSAEETLVRLEMSNQSLKLEADNLTKKIVLKDQELSEKHEELEKLQICVQDEHSRYVQVEATLHILQNLHSQSQEEQRALALELKNGIQMLKDLETSKHGLEEEIQQVKDENRSLNELNSSSTASMKNLENEILSMRKMKERLEEEVAQQLAQSNALQKQIFCLKEEIDGLNRSYQALMKQVELVGLNPKSMGSSVKDLQDENSKLRQICEENRDEKVALSRKIENVKELLEKNAVLNGELEGSREKAKELQDSCQFLHGEKSTLVLEKALLLSQLQIITENMQKLLEKNIVLDNSLCVANVELEGLRAKSNSLEELCQLLKNEKSNLVTERSKPIVQLESVEKRLGTLEKRFTEFEEKYVGMEKEKESTHSQVQELRVSLSVEKQERESFTLWNETRMADLENHIHLLEEDNKWRKREFQEELDKTVIAQFEIFILEKFIEDMEERNYSLSFECEKHIKASKLAEKLILELESENLEQHVEEELLLVEIEKLRLGIYQVFKALEIESYSGSKDKIENEQIFVDDILENIENMKCSISKYEDGRQQLLVENSVILTVFEQLKLKGQEMELEKNKLHHTFDIMKEQLVMFQKEKHQLVEKNMQLRSEVSKGEDRSNILKGELKSLYVKQGKVEGAYLELLEKYSQALEENSSLLKNFSVLKEEKCMVEEENDVIVLEALALGSLSTMLKSFGTEKAAELKSLYEDLQNLHGFNNDLEKEVIILREKLEMREVENLLLKDSIERLEMEPCGIKDCNVQLKQEILSGKDFLNQKEKEMSEAEQKLKETENMNSEMCLAMEGLKRKCEESEVIRERLEKCTLKLSEDNANQNRELDCLHEVNGNLVSELDVLHEDMDGHKIREEKLRSELQEKENDFALWEAEATTFYFDLQISNVREALFEDKVHKLTGVCESLEDETASKTVEIEQMKERANFMESEIGGLKARLLAYTPVIESLKENMASLEQNSLSLAKLIVADNQKPKDAEVRVHPHQTSYQELLGDQSSPIPNGIFDLEEVQTRIIAVEEVVVKDINRLLRQESSSKKLKLEAARREIEELKSKCSSHQEKERKKEERGLGNGFKLIKMKPEISEVRKRILTKDIPLDQLSDGSFSRRGSVRADDQMIELWQTAMEDRNLCQTVNKLKRQPYEPIGDAVEELGVDKLEVPTTGITVANQGGSKGKILQRLASDAKKLASLQTTVQDLKKKSEMNKKSIKGNKGGVDIETVKEQLEEVEETVLELVDLNGQLVDFSDGMSSAEQDEASNVWQKKVYEQAWKGSEKIGRLQLEAQKIRYVLLKLEDENKSKGKSKFLITKSRTSIILRDFLHGGRRSSGRRKKNRLCGCIRPSTNGDSSPRM